MKRCSLVLAVLAAALIAVAPEAAWAHGIADSARDKSVAEFLPLGIEHMLLGWDHLLFIAGVVLLAGDLKRAAKLISLFVAGHSLTLLVATMAGWQISATVVDVVIALSVVFVGVIGLRDGPRDWRLIGASVLGFGLIHGLGLSTRLQHLGLPEDGLLWRVVAFNVGVEIGQLIALTVIVGLGALLIRRLPRRRLQRAAFATFVATGLLAAGALSLRGAEEAGTPVSQRAQLSNSACREAPTQAPAFGAGGEHPDKQFYRPGEKVPVEDLAHVVGDGLAIVRYHPSLPADQRRRLADWAGDRTQAVIAAADDQQTEPVRAHTARSKLTCTTFDFATLNRFRDRWIADVQAGRVG
jgi:hydrogenase/urease accessory protein HupE